MKLFLLIVSIIFLIGCEKSRKYALIDANITFSSKSIENLSKRHLDYWEAMSKRDFNTTFSYELPYLQFIKSKKWYANFNQSNNYHYSIIQKNIILKTPHIASIKTFYELNDNTYTFEDHWYLVNDSWYHKFKTSKLP